MQRVPDPDDRRAMRVALPAHGESVLADVDAERRNQADLFFAGLSDRDRASLAAILGKLDPREG